MPVTFIVAVATVPVRQKPQGSGCAAVIIDIPILLSARMTHKRRMMVALLAAVACGLCLLTTLPAVLLMLTGQGGRIVAGHYSEQADSSKAYDVVGGDGGRHSSVSHGECPAPSPPSR